MNVEEIKTALNTALAMRPPRWDPEDPPRGGEKVSRLEDYMLQAAWMHAELEDCLHHISAAIKLLQKQVDEITGWEVALPSGKTTARATKEDVNQAKRKLKPELFDAGGEARQLRESILRQIARFEHEEVVLSRAYTLISGG